MAEQSEPCAPGGGGGAGGELGFCPFLGRSATTTVGIKHDFCKIIFLSQFDPLPISKNWKTLILEHVT